MEITINNPLLISKYLDLLISHYNCDPHKKVDFVKTQFLLSIFVLVSQNTLDLLRKLGRLWH